jgi:hypothetical protein
MYTKRSYKCYYLLSLRKLFEMRSSMFSAQRITLRYRSANLLSGLTLNIPVNTRKCFKSTEFWTTLYNGKPLITIAKDFQEDRFQEILEKTGHVDQWMNLTLKVSIFTVRERERERRRRDRWCFRSYWPEYLTLCCMHYEVRLEFFW